MPRQLGTKSPFATGILIPASRVFLCVLWGALVVAVCAKPLAAQDDNTSNHESGISQDRVDLYGDQLPAGAIARLGKIGGEAEVGGEPPPFHTQTVQEVQFSPDGKLIATSGLELAIRVWDAATGEQLHYLQDATHPYGFTPDGQSLIYTSAESYAPPEVRVWNLESNEVLGKSSDTIDEFVFRPSDGMMLCTFNGRLTMRQLPQLDKVELPRASFGRILALSPDTEFLVAAAGENVSEVHIHRTRSGVVKQSISLGARERSRRLRVSISPDNRLLAVAGDTHVIYIWELATGTELHRFTGHRRDIHALQFSPDAKYLVSAGLGGEARIWNLNNWQEVESNIEQAEEIKAIAFSADGTRLATASSDRTALVWEMNPELGEPIHPQPITAERFRDLWQDLASEEPNQAFHAASELAGEMSAAIPLVQERIDQILQPSQTARILELIAELDSDEYMIREQATEELIRFREVALDELNHALTETRSAEVRHRIKRILSTPEDTPRFTPAETNRMIRVIDILARDSSDDSVKVLRTIAAGFPSRDVMRAAQLALAGMSVNSKPD